MKWSKIRSTWRVAPPASGRNRALAFAPIFGFFSASAPVGFLACSSAAGPDDAGFPPAPNGDAGDSGTPDAAPGDARGDGAAVDAGTGPGDSGALVDAAPDAGGATPLPPDCLPDGGHGGSRWQDLYACYFGPTGTANCSLNSSCHGTGGGATNIWLCGQTSASCYQGMLVVEVPEGGASDPTTTGLYFSLRNTDGTGLNNMPLLPAEVIFGPNDLARIGTWIKTGARYN